MNLLAGTVLKSKRLNVVQSRAKYTNGDCDNTQECLLSRDSVSETQELQDNDHRDDNLNNISGTILIKNGK